MEAGYPTPSVGTRECDALDDISAIITRVEGGGADRGVEEEVEANGNAEGGWTDSVDISVED